MSGSRDRPRGGLGTSEAVAEARKAWQDADKLAALREGEHILQDVADVSYGTRGYSLHALERAGLMRIERVLRQSPMEDGSWRFSPTDAGLAVAARQQINSPN